MTAFRQKYGSELKNGAKLYIFCGCTVVVQRYIRENMSIKCSIEKIVDGDGGDGDDDHLHLEDSRSLITYANLIR